MSQTPPAIRLLHDGSSLASALARTLEGDYSVALTDKHHIPERAGDERWLVVASLRDHHWLEATFRQARELGVSLLLLGLEPGFIWFGPYLLPTESGCYRCLRLWAHSNNHEPTHWSRMANDPQTRRDDLPGMIPPAVEQMLTALLCHLLDDQLLLAEGSLYQAEGSNPIIRLDTTNSRISRHHFLPIHDCDICGNLAENSPDSARITLKSRPKAVDSDSRVANPRLALDSLKQHFLDRHVGLVRHVFHSLSSNLMPMFSAEMPIMYTSEVESGYGRSETRHHAELVAILETLERYAGHSPKGQRTTVRASYRALLQDSDKHVIDPRRLILHGEQREQSPEFRMHPYSDDLEFNWVWCHALLADKPILIPEQSIFYYLLNQADAPLNRFIYETSNGYALGGALEEAIFYGLLELVERDAYLTTWYGRFTPREIDLHQIDDQRIQALIHRVEAQNLRLHAFDMRVGIDVPVVWCMIVDDADDAPVKSYCAAGAHLVPENAIYSGLIEVTTSMGVYQESMPPLKDKALEMLADDNKVTDMHDHVLLYSLSQSWDRLSFLFDDRPKASLQELYGNSHLDADGKPEINRDVTEDLRQLMTKVSAYADDVIVADLTFDALKAHQLHCVKVIAPGLMPVTFGHQYRRVSLERINRYAESAGLATFASVDDLNPLPHNFP